MDLIFYLLPLALLFTFTSLGLFIWAVRGGQFEDLETPPLRILFEDAPGPPASESAGKINKEEREGSAEPEAPNPL